MKRCKLALHFLLVIEINFIPSPIIAVPIKNKLDEFSLGEIAIEVDECSTSGLLGISGRLKFLEDCKTLDRLDVPIAQKFNYGNIPRICCPKELSENSICFPSDPWCSTYQEIEYDYGYDDYGVEDQRVIEDLDFVCDNLPNTSCVPIHSCSEVSSPNTELFCGFESDQIKVCCKEDKLLEIPTEPSKPKFTPKTGSSSTYQCQDKTPHCKKWAENGACALDQSFKIGELFGDAVVSNLYMYNFMMLTCQKSCGWCKKQECVDEIPNCKEFAQQSYCELDTLFMAHTCRESCGTCGFLSPENTEEQVSDSNSYSDIQSKDFDCGRYKSLEEIEDAGVEVMADEFPDKPTDFIDNGDGTCEVGTDKTAPLTESIPEEFPTNIASADDFGIRNFDYDDNDDIDDTSFANSVENATIKCGTILISDRWMLSAAHCYDSLQATFDIRSTSFRTYLPDFKESVLQKRVFKHPNYRLPELYNDIALVELGRRITFDYDKLGDTPTCVSSKFDFDEKTASVTGYGETEDGSGSAGKNLGTVNITLTNYNRCDKILSKYISSKKNKKEKYCSALPYGIIDQHICGRPSAPVCSGGEIVYPGACKGDSGGPVEVEENGRRVLVGLVSGSLNCNSLNPEWFTRVAYFRDWIECIMTTAKGNVLSQAEIERECKGFVQDKPGSRSEFCPEE